MRRHDPPGAVRPLLGDHARRAAPALLAYAAVRGFGLVIVHIWGAVAGTNPHNMLVDRWDSVWYAHIAAHGYGWLVRSSDGGLHSDLAFFPLLPWLERLIAAVSPLSYADAGLSVSWAASLVAAWGIFAVADRLYGRRAGTCAVVLWAVLPVGFVQSMAYSESLFTALAAWTLYAVLSGHWVQAGLLALLAGLTRPAGPAVAAAVVVAAVVACVREQRVSWRAALGAVLAPLGAVGYLLWVGQRTGNVLGYLEVQEAWGTGFDAGWAFARFTAETFTSFPEVLGGVGIVVGVAAVIWLYVLCVRQGDPLPLLVFSGVVVVLALGSSGYFGSRPRLLMPAFPLFLPLALMLARLNTARSAVILAAVGVLSALFGAFWLHDLGPP